MNTHIIRCSSGDHFYARTLGQFCGSHGRLRLPVFLLQHHELDSLVDFRDIVSLNGGQMLLALTF